MAWRPARHPNRHPSPGARRSLGSSRRGELTRVLSSAVNVGVHRRDPPSAGDDDNDGIVARLDADDDNDGLTDDTDSDDDGDGIDDSVDRSAFDDDEDD